MGFPEANAVSFGGSEQAPALRCIHIIAQIGRENNISAEICLLRTVEDACPYGFVNILMRRSVIGVLFSLAELYEGLELSLRLVFRQW